MILSNEPGYYKEGAYGIRIENLVLVVEGPAVAGAEKTLNAFETLTLAPIDRRLVVPEMLSPAERAWLEAYSPYQKLKAGVDYPDPFFITSTADDRVTPVHGRKAAARMKEIGAPYLYFENMEGGHAAAANNPEKARNVALEYIYATQRLADGN